jgi:recombination protein RecT
MTQITQNTTAAQGAAVAPAAEKSFDLITKKIDELLNQGDIALPASYNAQNAMRSAWLQLSEQEIEVNGQKTRVLDVCTKPSIANALLTMVVQGMNPAKKQCYFIPYRKGGTYELQYQRSFGGSYALAKRVANIDSITANAVYSDDEFTFEIEPDGRKQITNHVSRMDAMEGDPEKLRGAYAVIKYADGSTQAIVKSMAQIRKAWAQGATKGASPAHKNFGDEMACKTVISAACKLLIMASDDSDLLSDNEEVANVEEEQPAVKTEANKRVFKTEAKPSKAPEPKEATMFEDASIVDEPQAPATEVVQIQPNF